MTIIINVNNCYKQNKKIKLLSILKIVITYYKP